MDPYHYPPNLIAQLMDAIPALCRSKRDVLSFFKQAGIQESVYADFVA
jgi:restriction system protein